jgi:hypothetical protein
MNLRSILIELSRIGRGVFALGNRVRLLVGPFLGICEIEHFRARSCPSSLSRDVSWSDVLSARSLIPALA